MTQKEFIEKQQKFIKDIILNDTPLKLAAFTAMKDISERVFEQGRNTAGGNIGQYDTKRPFYVNPKKSAGAAFPVKGLQGLQPPTGKYGDTKFKNGKDHKTTYVKNYKDFRNRIGRRIDRVNLQLSGDLRSDFSNGKVSNPIPQRASQHEYFVGISRAKNSKKIEGLEDKYGTVFRHSNDEIAKFTKIANLEYKNALTKAGL